MAISEVVDKNACNILVNNGRDSAGNIKTLSMSIGSLSARPNDWDAGKIMAIADALSPCLSKAIVEVKHVQTSTLIDE